MATNNIMSKNFFHSVYWSKHVFFSWAEHPQLFGLCISPLHHRHVQFAASHSPEPCKLQRSTVYCSPCFILCFKLRSNTFSPFCIRHYWQKANYVSDLLQTQRINIMKKNWYQSSIFIKFNASWEFLIGFLFPWTYHAAIMFEPTL